MKQDLTPNPDPSITYLRLHNCVAAGNSLADPDEDPASGSRKHSRRPSRFSRCFSYKRCPDINHALQKMPPWPALVAGFAISLMLIAPQRAHAAASALTPNVDTCAARPNDTERFLRAPTAQIRTAHGSLALVVASTFSDLMQGLMCVRRIPHGKGMIFVLPPPDRAIDFWMENTRVPLDMIFVLASGQVSSIAINVPATRVDFPRAAIARRTGRGRFVIELAAGESAGFGIVRGTTLDLHAIGTARSETDPTSNFWRTSR